eukprot:12542719-Heterocapsa_arctica.AAC.1
MNLITTPGGPSAVPGRNGSVRPRAPTAAHRPMMSAERLRELDTIVPREQQFVEPLERLPPLAVRLS